MIGERQLPARVVYGRVIQLFDLATRQFVAQSFEPDGTPKYEAPDGVPMPPDAFQDAAGTEYSLPCVLLQPAPPVQVVDLGMGYSLTITENGEVKPSDGIVETDSYVQSLPSQKDKMKAELCKAGMEGIFDLVGELAKRGVNLQDPNFKDAILAALKQTAALYG